MHEPAPDLIKIYCKGFCGQFAIIDLNDLLDTIRKGEGTYTGVRDFANSYICAHCESDFIIAVETADVKPLSLNDKPDPS